jgi:hypothetical protein
MPYVLFREPKNPNTATPTVYVTRDRETNELISTTSRKKALEFETAAEGYQFGTENALDDWRVGERQ